MNYAEQFTLSIFGLMLWREARGESDEGILAVAHTVMERVMRPKWWSMPRHDVISVITRAYQYTSMGYRGDPQILSYPDPNDPWMQKCMFIAEQVLAGATIHPAPGASHYYNPETVFEKPEWAIVHTSKFIKKIGRHEFYYVES